MPKESERNKYQKIIAEVLGTKLIAFNPDLARVLGSAKAGLLLNQLLYWWKKGNNPEWIYKTIKDIEKETTLSRTEQETAIEKCIKFNLMEMKRKGIPAKRHFRLHINEIVKLLGCTLLKTNKQDCIKPANLITENLQTNTESNTKNTNKENSLFLEKELIKTLVNWNNNQSSPTQNAEAIIKNTVRKYGYERVSEALKKHGQDQNNSYYNFCKHLKQECCCYNGN